MKFSFATALLISSASSKGMMLLDDFEDDLTEDLTVTMNRYDSRRLDDKARKFHDIQRQIERMMPGRSPDADRWWANEADELTQDAFGWKFEDKMKSIDQKKYADLLKAVMDSKEVKDQVDFYKKAVNDPLLQKIMKDVEFLSKDVFGGCSRYGGCSRGMRASEIRSRPDPSASKNLSRDERDKLEIEGASIDNGDLKDVAEDLQDIFSDIEKLMDLDSDFNKEAIKVDAHLRFSKPVQALARQIMKDLGIKTEADLGKIVKKIEKKAESMFEHNAYLARAEKSADRTLRYLMQHLEISDLPKGKRMQWVNKLAQQLYDATKADHPVKTLENIVEKHVDGFLREMMHYLAEAEKREQAYNKDGGL